MSWVVAIVALLASITAISALLERATRGSGGGEHLAASERWAAAVLLGPVALAAVTLGLEWCSLDPALAARGALLLAILITLWGGWRALRTDGWIDSRIGVSGIVVGLAPLLLFFATHRFEATAWDSELHAELASALSVRRPPIENPFLAGVRLAYPWWWNLEAAVLHLVSGLALPRVMALLSLHALLGLLLATALLVPRELSPRAARVVPALVFWGPNAIGGLLLVARWFVGQGVGLNAIQDEMRSFALALDQASLGYSPRLAFPAHKWLQGGSYAATFALLFLIWHLLARLRAGGTRGHAVLLGLVMLGFGLLHYMSALLLLPVLLATAIVLPVDRDATGARPPVSGRLAIVIAGFAALLALAPYLATTLGAALSARGGREVAFGWNLPSLLGLLLVPGPWLVLAWLERPRAFTARDPERLLLVSAGILGALGICTRFSDQNVTKLLFPAAFVAPLVAAPALERALARGRGWRWAARLLLFGSIASALVMVTLAALWAPDPSLYRRDARIDALLAAVPEDAILVTDELLPMTTRRASYLTHPTMAGQWGFREELGERAAVIGALKGAPPRRPEHVPAALDLDWIAPRAFAPEEAWRALLRVSGDRPLVFVVPKNGWPGLDRARLKPLGAVDESELWLLDPR
ncbi:MAG: hypothetical protein U0527_05075 [Candidatus Eisenbacteria bacterium]